MPRHETVLAPPPTPAPSEPPNEEEAQDPVAEREGGPPAVPPLDWRQSFAIADVMMRDPLNELLEKMEADHASVPSLSAQIASAKLLLGERDRQHEADLARARELAGDTTSIRQAIFSGFGPVALVVAFIGLVFALRDFFFGASGDPTCGALGFDTHARSGIETFVGLAPVWARNCLILFVLTQCCRKVSGMEGDSSLATALLIGQRQHRGGGSAAGWVRIVTTRVIDGVLQPQPTWAEASEARKLSRRQAISSAGAKLILWHWSQPMAYLLVLEAYKCGLDDTQQLLASLVAAREVLYLATTLVATVACPVFLLIDTLTIYKEAKTRLQRGLRLAAYVLIPHNFVTLCLANRFQRWRVAFLVLAGIQVIADFGSCCALVSLLATRVEGAAAAPTAMLIGYTITAAGFILFFGPWAVATNIAAAADKTKRRWVRTGRGLSAGMLMVGLCYIIAAIGLLMAGTDIVCKGITFGSPECNHGMCAAGGQRCDCDYGYGPEEFDHGTKGVPEGACGTRLGVCTRGQISRGSRQPTSSSALPQQCSNLCCSGHGSCAIDGTCACEFGWYGQQCESQWCTESVDSPTCAASCCAGVGTCHSSSGGGHCECQHPQGVGAVRNRLSCDSQAELNTAVEFSVTICKQVGETYADAVSQAPSTCHSLLCAEALETVKLRCGLFLSSSPFLASRRRELEEAVERCHKVPRRPGCDEHPLSSSDATPSRIDFGATPCSGFVTTLTGSPDTFSAMTVTIDAGPGRLVQLNVTVLASQSDDRGYPADPILVYDGDYSDARGPLLAQYHGPGGEPLQWSSLPNTTVAVSSGRMMSLRTFPNPSRLSAFVGAISCVLPCVGSIGETNSPCGVHGTACYLDDANRAICTCESGYGGAACEQQCVNGTCFAVVGTRDAQLSGTYIRSSEFSCHGQPVYVQDDGSSGGYVLYQPPSGYREWDISTLATFDDYSCERDPDKLYASGCDGTPDSCSVGRWYEPSATVQSAQSPTALVVPTWGSGCAAVPDCGHGVCIAAGASHSCTCDYGYSGASCTHDPCTDAQCPGRHSRCVRNANGLGYTCPCYAGWHGTNCDLNCTNGFCHEFTIAGTRDPQLHGIYTKTGQSCNGKPVYQQGGNGRYFLYAERTSDSSDWDVSTAEHVAVCESEYDNNILWASRCDGTPDRCLGWSEPDPDDHSLDASNTATRVVATSGSGCAAAPDCGHGVCISTGANHTCGCDYGYSGPSCAYDPCDGDPCTRIEHSSVCTRDSDGRGHTCSCDVGWYGTNCETAMASAYKIAGTHNDQLSGIYSKTDQVCGGKPVYQKGGSVGYVLFNLYHGEWDVRTSDKATTCTDTSNSAPTLYNMQCGYAPDSCTTDGWQELRSTNSAITVVAVDVSGR